MALCYTLHSRLICFKTLFAVYGKLKLQYCGKKNKISTVAVYFQTHGNSYFKLLKKIIILYYINKFRMCEYELILNIKNVFYHHC